LVSFHHHIGLVVVIGGASVDVFGIAHLFVWGWDYFLGGKENEGIRRALAVGDVVSIVVYDPLRFYGSL